MFSRNRDVDVPRDHEVVETPNTKRHVLLVGFALLTVACFVAGAQHMKLPSANAVVAFVGGASSGVAVGYHEPSYMHSAAERAQLDGLVRCAYHGHHSWCMR